jgi:hypothetical protein
MTLPSHYLFPTKLIYPFTIYKSIYDDKVYYRFGITGELIENFFLLVFFLNIFISENYYFIISLFNIILLSAFFVYFSFVKFYSIKNIDNSNKNEQIEELNFNNTKKNTSSISNNRRTKIFDGIYLLLS